LSFEEEIRLKREGDGEKWRDKRGRKVFVLKSIDIDKETEVTILI
jgi:hypothetical protein